MKPSSEENQFHYNVIKNCSFLFTPNVIRSFSHKLALLTWLQLAFDLSPVRLFKTICLRLRRQCPRRTNGSKFVVNIHFLNTCVILDKSFLFPSGPKFPSLVYCVGYCQTLSFNDHSRKSIVYKSIT